MFHMEEYKKRINVFYSFNPWRNSKTYKSETRFNNAMLLNDKDKLHLFQANICDPSSYKKHIKQNYVPLYD